jgi:hypothetical protein
MAGEIVELRHSQMLCPPGDLLPLDRILAKAVLQPPERAARL